MKMMMKTISATLILFSMFVGQTLFANDSATDKHINTGGATEGQSGTFANCPYCIKDLDPSSRPCGQGTPVKVGDNYVCQQNPPDLSLLPGTEPSKVTPAPADTK